MDLVRGADETNQIQAQNGANELFTTKNGCNLVQAQDLLDILDDRFGHASTMINAQIPGDIYYARIPYRTLADAILDRLVNIAYRLQLSGDSQRHLRSILQMSAT